MSAPKAAQAIVKTRRGRVHLLAHEGVAGHSVAVATMACGDVLAPQVLTYIHDLSAVHPFDWCRGCAKEYNA
jgi:hypothetical protein